MTLLHALLSLLSGGLVGFTLGLVGGGGSVIAVPLMVYVVGVKNPHLAIGTSAFAVAVNAMAGLAGHARVRNVNWGIGSAFAVSGMVGAAAGSSLGKLMDGQRLLFLFALLMLVVAGAMFGSRGHGGIDGVRCHRGNVVRVAGYGLFTGCLSGFFGIGGGFLIVPALIAATSMPIYQAIGTSLVAVSAFGLTTAGNYALSGLIDWPLASTFIVGGLAGTVVGTIASRHLSAHKGRLNTLFAGGIVLVALYMLFRSWMAFAVVTPS